MRWFSLVFAILLLAATAGTVSAQQPAGREAALTNAEVVKLTKLDLGDEVVIAKVNQAAAVSFDLSPDGLVKLKSGGVSKEVIAAMLKRATPPSQQPRPGLLAVPNFPGIPNAQSFSPQVSLRSKDGEIELVGRHGQMSYTYIFIGYLVFVNYPGAASKVVITNPRPAILAHLKDDPNDRQGSNVAFLVKLDPDKKEDKRSLKIGQASRDVGFGAPDADWTLPFDAEQESPGVWRIVPKADLKPGEYGLYISGIGTLFDFAVDQ